MSQNTKPISVIAKYIVSILFYFSHIKRIWEFQVLIFIKIIKENSDVSILGVNGEGHWTIFEIIEFFSPKYQHAVVYKWKIDVYIDLLIFLFKP